MSDVKITADTREVERLGENFHAAAEVGLRRVTERGEQILRREVPKVTHNLEQGVSSEVVTNAKLLQGNLIVSARSGRLGPRRGTVHLASGKTKQVTLRGQPSFNYAEAVARGTGIYGPHHTEIIPARGQALLIPVQSVPSLNGKPEAYIEVGGQKFIVRRSIKGKKANPYHERAAKRLEAEAQPIFNKALETFDQAK